MLSIPYIVNYPGHNVNLSYLWYFYASIFFYILAGVILPFNIYGSISKRILSVFPAFVICGLSLWFLAIYADSISELFINPIWGMYMFYNLSSLVLIDFAEFSKPNAYQDMLPTWAILLPLIPPLFIWLGIEIKIRFRRGK
jgi:hypothetical protein